jgi:hypothetical protein
MYVYTFLLRMTDTMTYRNIYLSSWDTLYSLASDHCKITRRMAFRSFVINQRFMFVIVWLFLTSFLARAALRRVECIGTGRVVGNPHAG